MDEREFSRVKAGTTSFGLRGRLVISAICLAPCLFMWFMVGGIGARTPTDIAVTMLPVFPGLILPFFFLRNAWRSHRIK